MQCPEGSICLLLAAKSKDLRSKLRAFDKNNGNPIEPDAIRTQSRSTDQSEANFEVWDPQRMKSPPNQLARRLRSLRIFLSDSFLEILAAASLFAAALIKIWLGDTLEDAHYELNRFLGNSTAVYNSIQARYDSVLIPARQKAEAYVEAGSSDERIALIWKHEGYRAEWTSYTLVTIEFLAIRADFLRKINDSCKLGIPAPDTGNLVILFHQIARARLNGQAYPEKLQRHRDFVHLGGWRLIVDPNKMSSQQSDSVSQSIDKSHYEVTRFSDAIAEMIKNKRENFSAISNALNVTSGFLLVVALILRFRSAHKIK